MIVQRKSKIPSVPRLPVRLAVGAGSAFLLILLGACDLGSGPPPSPATIQAVSGTDQTATVGQPVSIPPAVRILDSRGTPMSGREVLFSVTSGGGTVLGAVTLTDADGVARVGGWTLGTTAGSNTLQAGIPELLPFTFHAEGQAGPPASITAHDGQVQNGVVGSHTPLDPSVRVRDEFGNPVPDVEVEFQVSAGGGSLAGGNAVTDAFGVARAGPWTLGTAPGTNTLTASLLGLDPVAFTAEAMADQPAQITVLQGDQQVGTVGTVLALPPSLSVADRFGNLLAGVPVHFEVIPGSGVLEGGHQTTDAFGVATAGSWTLGTGAGVQTLAASVDGLDPVTLTATAVPGAPVSSTAANGGDQTATVGTPVPVPPAVLVQDAFGNPVPDVTVTFAETGVPPPAGSEDPPESQPAHASAGDESTVDGQNAVTGLDGIATIEAWVLGTAAGEYRLSAFVAGLAEPVVFEAAAVPDLPAFVSKEQGDHQTTQIGQAVGVPPVIRVFDQYSNGVEGVEVEFLVTDGGGAVSGPNTTTDLNGRAAVGSWVLGSVPGPNALSATATGVGTVTFEATGLTAVPAAIEKVAGDNQLAAVGTAVPVRPQVRVTDAGGQPISWVTVTFTVFSGGGTLTQGSVVTDAAGLAAVGSWTLGGISGGQILQASVETLDPVSFLATGEPGPPATLSVARGEGQSATTNTPVAVPPSFAVRDEYGNVVPDVSVVFSVTQGGGVVTGSPARTDSNGEATVGSWVLGPTPGPNELTATVAGAGSAAVQATGVPAIPAAIEKVEGDGQIAEVGTAVGVAPQVRVTDSGGNPIATIEVSFAGSLGGGSVSDEVVLTDAEGKAKVGSWVLGTTAGLNALEASTSGLPPVTFAATGVPGPPETMVMNQGDGQSAQAGSTVPLAPSVLIEDHYGNAVSGVSVSFAAISGGGSVSGSPAVTDPGGIAMVGSWTLGPTPGSNELDATSSGLPPVMFTATAIAAGGFDVELQFMTAVDPAQETIFLEAADRWEEVIVGDLPDFAGTLPAEGCQPVEESGGIDDVKVYITIKAIDGAGGVLGRAGPCYIWNPGNPFPISGIMELDEADVLSMQTNGTLKDVIIHELGHILGIGTLWNAYSNEFLMGPEGTDPYFNGPAAIGAFDAAGGDGRTDPKVPVENTGGAGTRNSHWRETVHNAELMTGWIEPGGTPNPLSAITVASLADMGYVVNMNAADPYTLFNPMGAAHEEPSRKLIFIKELPPPTPIPIGSGGRP